jgi:hypothetical protein
MATYMSNFIEFKCVLIKVFGKNIEDLILDESKSEAELLYNFEEFYKNLILCLFFPIMVNMVMIILYCLTSFKFVMIPRAKVISIIVISFWFLQPDICRMLFASISC